MTAIETSVANWFETTLTSSITGTSTVFAVADVGALTAPAYIVIDPDSAAKREVVLVDGTFTATSWATTTTVNRGLDGSAAGAQAHDAGTRVVVTPLAQHIRDLHDRVDDAGTDLTAHAADTTAIHGIADTSALETTTGSQAKADAAQAAAEATAAGELTTHAADTTAVHGITDTSVLAVKNADNSFSSKQTFAGEVEIDGALNHDGTTVGFNGEVPVTKRTLGAAATDAATTQTLANNLRQALIDLGLGQT